MRSVMMMLAVAMLSVILSAHGVAAGRLPEGRIAFMRAGSLWLWEAGKEHRLAAMMGYNPRFSADGRYVAFASDDALWVVPAAGGRPWRIADIVGRMRHEWSPAGPSLAFTTREGVFTVTMTEHGPDKPVLLARGWADPAWSPDGKELAILRQEPGEPWSTGMATIGVVPRSGGAPRVIVRERYPGKGPCEAGPLTDPVWSADGEWLAVYRIPSMSASLAADCDELAVVSVKQRILAIVGTSPANTEWRQWAPSGATLAFTDGQGRMAFANKAVRVAPMPPMPPFRTHTPKGYADREPVWSRDGRYLALTRSLAESPNNMSAPAPGQAIWMIDAVTGKGDKVPGSDGGHSPRWGRDGGLLWARWAEGGSSLWYGSDGKPLAVISEIDLTPAYYGQWCLSCVFDWWLPAR